jgi:hypothetical protein
VFNDKHSYPSDIDSGQEVKKPLEHFCGLGMKLLINFLNFLKKDYNFHVGEH